MTAREVILDGGCPWGFRMTGGADVGYALRISRVNPASKASVKGVREGDVITSINGQPTKCLTNGESHTLLRTVGNTLRLGLNEDTNGSPKRKNKDATKRDTAGSSTQSVNSSPAAAPSSTTVVDVTVDSAAPSSSNAKGKKSRIRQNQDKTEENKSKTVQEVQNTVISKTIVIETEINCKSTGMSSSRARRMRKARLNNKKKNGQEETTAEECNTQLNNEDSDSALVKENELPLTKESDSVRNDKDLVEILVVVDSEDLRELHSGTIETLTPLPDLVQEERETVNAWLDRRTGEGSRSADRMTASLVKRETLNSLEEKCEALSVNNRELNKLENNERADTPTKRDGVEHFPTKVSNDVPNIVNLTQTETISKSVCTKTISVVESESSKNSSKIIVKEIVLPRKEDVILPDNSRKTDSLITEQVKTHASSVHDCALCKEKRFASDVKKVSFANIVDSEKTATICVIHDSPQESKKLTCRIGVLPTQETATQSVVKTTTLEEPTLETNEVLLRKSPVSVFIHPPDNLAEITNTPRLSWDSVSDIESTSSHTQFSSSDDEIHSDMLIYLPSNEMTSAKIVVDTTPDAQFDDYNLSVHDIRDPLIEPEEEKQLRQYLKTLDLTKPEEFDDSSSSKSHEESSLTSGSETDSTKEEIVVYKHIRSRCIPETCYIPADRRGHLEVITEEGSDPSDVERIPDFSRPWENSTTIRQNNEIHGIPNDWFGSDEDNIETSDEDGIDISWGNGTKLEDVEGVEIVYLGDNSEDDEEIMNRTFRESSNKRNNSLTQPELVVVHEVDLDDVKNTLEICDVVDGVSENEQKKNKVQEIIDILNNTYEINKDAFVKCVPKVENGLNDTTQDSEPKYRLEPNPEEEINLIDSETNTLENDSYSILSTFNDQKYKENRETSERNIDHDECPVPQEKFDATTPPPTYSRQGSSSSGTGSQSTAKYYPGQSPMSSESEDRTENDANESVNRKKKCILNPTSLKRLAENAVVSLPNGGYFLEQIGFYSQDKPFQVNHEGYKLSHLPPSGVSTRRSSSYQELENITFQPLPAKNSPFNSPPGSVVMVSSPPPSCLPSSPPPLEDNQWVGMPTSVDPRLLVCLSPSQSKTKTMPTPKEASGLLDLHKKFMERRGYHEQYKRNSFSPINDKSSTPDFTNSPDLLRLDTHESDKSGLYTPELLTEAASLLALKQYRQTRFKQDNSGVELNSKTDSGGRVACESYVEIEEKWKELEAIRSGETASKFKTNIFSTNKTDDAISTESKRQYNLDKTAELVDVLNATERDLQQKEFTKTVDKLTCANSVVNHETKQNHINVNDNVIKEAGVCAEMTSQRPEINRRFDDRDVNSSTGSSASRLLAIIQGTDASTFSGFNDLRNNAVPLEMNCVENSARESHKTEESRTFIGNNFISNWLTMSQNVGSNREIDCKNVDDNQSATAQNEFPFIDSDIWESFGMNTAENKYQRRFEADKYKISKQGDIAVMDPRSSEVHKLRRDRPKSLPPLCTPAPTGGELFREKMYQEYMDKVAERSERRQQKVIKISNRPASMYSKIEDNDNNTFIDTHKLENEFMGRVKDRMNKLGIPIDDGDDEVDESQLREEAHLPEDLHVRLPKHLQEFLELTLAPPTEIHETATDWRSVRNKQGQRIGDNLLKEIDQALILGRGFLTAQGVWSPVGTPEAQRKEFNFKDVQKDETDKNKPEETGGEPAPVVWTPKSANASPTLEKKSFRPVNFESPTFSRKVYSSQNSQEEPKPPTDLPITLEWKKDTGTTVTTRAAVEREVHAQSTISREEHAQSISSRLVTSHSAPDTSILGTDSKLPRAQNPTITLLQKAREGQLPRGAHYLEQDTVVRDKDNKSPTVYPNEIIYSIRKEYESETEDKQPKKIVELGPRKFEGIGPTTKEGIPIVLRSEVKDVNQQKWYKRMYDSLHKAERDKDSVTVRYKTRRGRYPYTSSGGYLSEPEPLGGGYDSDYISSKYATLDRRRIRNKENDFTTSTMPRNKGYGNAVKHAVDVYKNQPGRIEDYEPGSSSIADKETKQWWDEVMDIFDGQFEQTQKSTASRPQNIPSTRNTKPYMTYALKESGYESDSTLVFKRRDEQQQQLSPAEQKTIYKTIQKGGEVPLHGLRKPAPERPKDDTEIEYFPISPHLTRIRIHKSKQSIKPIKEIICYPLTSIETDNPPPVFSTYKRTARPSLSLYRHKPPSPPKRRSSRNNSTLRLYSKMSISPYTLYKSQPGRLPSGGIEVDSNVEYLKERLTSKLNSRLKTTRRRETSIPKVITSKREHISRTGSLSPSIRTSVLTTSQGTGKVTKPIIETKSLRSRRDQLTPTRLVQGSDLRAPTEVKKVLKEQEAKESSTSKSLPSSTVVKSSTTLYSSARSSKKPKEDKSLKVSVAISSKGKELLRTSSTTSNKNLKESTLEPKKVERVRTVPSPIPKTSSVKSRTSSRADSDKRPSSRSTSRETVNSVHSTKQLKTSPGKITLTSLISVDQNKKVRKIESTTELSKKKKSKQSSSDSKPITIIKNLTSKKTAPDSNSDTNGKKRTKKVKENSDSPGSTKKSSKKNGVKKSRDKEVTRKTNDRNITDITNISNAGSAVAKLDNVINSEFGDFEIRPAGPLQSDSFFQHLLLRNVSSPTPSNISSLYRSSSVLDKARKFNETEEQKNVPYKSEPSLRMMNVYLNHKKPVTDSKFRSLDRDGASVRSSRSQSPYYARGRHFEFLEKIDHFDKINNVWDKCSGIYSPCFSREISPDYKERSSSEPPHSSPTDESQTAQHIEFGNIENAHWDYDNLSPLHSRSPSSRRIRSARSTTKTIESIGGLRKKGLRAKSLGDTESNKNLSSIQAYSTSSLNLSNMTDHTDYQTYVMELLHSTKKSDRFRELHKFYSSLERMGELERTTSSSDLRPRMKGEEIIDYDRWKRVRMKERAEEELKVLYEKLKEDQKEKDLLFRTRDSTELKWRGERDRGLRNKEKSVEDLRHQFHKLAMEDSDIEVTKRRDLDAKKDVYKPLWRGSSVVNLANALTSTVSSRRGRPVSDVCHSISVPPRLDRGNFGHSIGSRLWSSLSMEQVNALKNQLSEIYSTVSNLKRERINRMIHGKSSHKDYEITVPPAETSKNGTTEPLHVRCHSLLTNEQLYSPHNRRRETRRKECTKADSIGSIPQWKGSKGSSSSDSTNSSVTQPLSENEKKKISMTLSQEVLERATKKQSDDRKKKKKVSASIVIPRETLGAVAAVKGSRKFPRPKSPSLSETNSPRTCYSIEMSEEGSTERQMSSTSSNKGKNDFLLVLTPKDDDTQEVKKVVDEWALNKYHIKSPKDNHVVARLVRTTSNSETESGSSEASTVIHLGSREDIQKKETFGSKRSQIFESKRTRRSREKIEDKVSLSVGDIRPFSEEIKQRAKSAPGAISSKQSKLKLSSSQSFTNLKDLFGEQKATMYATVPLRKSIPSRTSVLSSTSIENKTRSTSPGPHSSQESIIRSRSISPDPMKYYRAYLNMVKAGDVRKLRDKFESLDDLHASQEDIQDTSPPLKRIQSDPDLTRDFLSRRSDDITTIVRGQEVGDVQWLKRKYEDRTHQSRSVLRRAVSPIPLKADNRFMPHINVISKLASLQQRRSLTVPPRPEPCVYRTGTVDKIRQQFELQQEELSLLGQMYTSAPDVRELKDIAPYLECDWIAHQYPKPRSLSSPETQRSLTYSPKPRPASASPVRRHQTSSILKSQQKKRDIFANQQFDPTIHRPLYRYQPPYPMDSSHHYRPWRRDPNWWWRHVYPSTKPTVTFKEPNLGRHIPATQRQNYPKDRQQESPHRYVESEVTIHYRSPVRAEEKEAWSEEELQRRQAEAMRRIYQEERRRKYLQELQDMYSRRHTDNFTPSQKSPIPLNRYDDFLDDLSPTKPRDRTPEPKLVARALYNFVGQTSRELSFRRGDIIYVRRQIDKNWYEGEHNAMVGLFPFNYVEIIPYDGIRTVPKKASEGQARAKFNFQAQTHLELPLVKGELVLLTRRVDENWYEGRIGNRKGIFPVSYVDILVEPGERTLSPVRISPSNVKPIASPASHSLHVSSNMSQHHYQPPRPVSYTSLPRAKLVKPDHPPVNQTLHIDTQNEPVPYRVLYNYKPQNEDELELNEGETVYVMEKCDDGWYVGSSQRTGYLGTFPGNYVERIV